LADGRAVEPGYVGDRAEALGIARAELVHESAAERVPRRKHAGYVDVDLAGEVVEELLGVKDVVATDVRHVPPAGRRDRLAERALKKHDDLALRVRERAKPRRREHRGEAERRAAEPVEHRDEWVGWASGVVVAGGKI
jgi:hypothetical protein